MQVSKKRSITPVTVDIPVYNAGKRVGPPTMKPIVLDYNAVVHDAITKNLLWSLVRQVNTSDQTVSSWTGFNILIRDDITVKKDTVGYLSTINAPATQMSTVFEILNQVLRVKEALDLSEIAVVFDQALYAKAAEISWKHLQYDKIVLRLGAFHTVLNLLSIIGKCFGSAGLRDISVESGIISEGSIESVLNGHKYNRGARLTKLVYEALLRLAWKGFYPWLEKCHTDDMSHLNASNKVVSSLHDDISKDTMEATLHDPSCSKILQRFSEYLNHLRINSGQL